MSDTSAFDPARPRIGLLVPAPNIVLERDFARWIGDRGSIHVNRLFATSVRPNDMRQNLEDLTRGVDDCARLLGMASPSVIAFGCTSGSFYRGPQWEVQVCDKTRSATSVHHVVLTARAVSEALRTLGARRIAVVSPYPPAVNELMIAYLQHDGFDILGLSVLDAWAGGGIPKLSRAEILRLTQQSPHQAADAVFLSCTNLRAGELIDELEALLGKPVVTSNQATFWSCMRAIGMEMPRPGLGALAAH